jgi:hypothetical protein
MPPHIEPDAVLEELWAIREQIMRESDYDIHRMGEALRARTAQWEREGFTFVGKPLPRYLREGLPNPDADTQSPQSPGTSLPSPSIPISHTIPPVPTIPIP